MDFPFNFGDLKIIQDTGKLFSQISFCCFIVHRVIRLRGFRTEQGGGHFRTWNYRPQMKLILLLDKLIQQLAKQQEHVDSASLVTGMIVHLTFRGAGSQRGHFKQYCPLSRPGILSHGDWMKRSDLSESDLTFLLDCFAFRDLPRKNINKAAGRTWHCKY